MTFPWPDAHSCHNVLKILCRVQVAGVTMVDHHTASHSFIKHMQNETKLRGGCPGDWVSPTRPQLRAFCSRQFRARNTRKHKGPNPGSSRLSNTVCSGVDCAADVVQRDGSFSPGDAALPPEAFLRVPGAHRSRHFPAICVKFIFENIGLSIKARSFR